MGEDNVNMHSIVIVFWLVFSAKSDIIAGQKNENPATMQ